MIEKIKKYRLVALLSLASLAFAAGGFFWALGALGSAASGPLILHFNDMSGITSIGNFSDLLAMGMLGIIIVIINFFIAIELEARDKVLGKAVAVMTLIVAVLLFLAFAAIIKVN
jgi:ABC-type glycerol-3-phosphate transport system permease component